MIVNIIILFESGRRIQMITTTLQKNAKGLSYMENHDFFQICCSKPYSVREPSNLDDHYLCKFVVRNHPLCEEPSNLDNHYPLEISCPKPPSLQGGLQFG